MRISIPASTENITKEVPVVVWYNFFYNTYKKVIGYFDSTLSATVLKSTSTEGNVLAAETAITNFLIQAGDLNINEVIDIFIGGTFAANGNNKTLKLKLNATTYYTSTVATNGGSWSVQAKIINLGASQKIFIKNGATTTYLTTAIDTSTTNIDFIATLQGTATNDLVKTYLEINYNA